jgi:hypothetical protein
MVIVMQNDSAEERKCHICNQQNAQGIWLIGGYICATCLDEISATDAQDPRYNFFIGKLKELWLAG